MTQPATYPTWSVAGEKIIAYYRIFKAFDFCLPTNSTTVPSGAADWLHEVKYDGYRLRLEGDGDRVRLITRGGYN